MKELKIHPIRKKRRKKHMKKVNSILPQPEEGAVCLIANTCSGKTSTILNCAFKWYADYYKDGHIWWVSPTCEADENTWMLAETDNITTISEIDDLNEILMAIYEKQKEDFDNDVLKPAWIICDDCIGLGLHSSKALEKLSAKGRHLMCNLWITSQNYKKLSVTIRYNSSYMFFWKLNSKRELNLIDEELNGLFPDFLKYYHEATKEPYSFLYADMKKGILRKNFGKILYDKNKNNAEEASP